MRRKSTKVTNHNIRSIDVYDYLLYHISIERHSNLLVKHPLLLFVIRKIPTISLMPLIIHCQYISSISANDDNEFLSYNKYGTQTLAQLTIAYLKSCGHSHFSIRLYKIRPTQSILRRYPLFRLNALF